MNNKNLTKFIYRTLVVLSPFLLFLLLYIILDPFKVIHSHPPFYKKGDVVDINRGYVSTATYEKQYRKYKYDSFIFGNSRSRFYEISDWQKYLPPNSSCYHFDASSESLYGIYKKILYIDKKGGPLNNVLIIVDVDALARDKSPEGHLFIIPPQLENNNNILKFHATSFKSFCYYKFLYAFLNYKITGKVKDNMRDNLLPDDETFDYNQTTNEIRLLDAEQKIRKAIYYTSKKLYEFHRMPGNLVCEPVIKDSQRRMLEKIKNIFTKHHTNYRIVISPQYDQIKFNPEDLRYLEDLFGKDFVFDFSGRNTLTENYKNYYDKFHYRPQVARQIMEIIYETDSAKRANMIKVFDIK
jgi:hypothetical protein